MTTTDSSPIVEPLRDVVATPDVDRSREVDPSGDGRATYNPARALRIRLLRPVGKSSRRVVRVR